MRKITKEGQNPKIEKMFNHKKQRFRNNKNGNLNKHWEYFLMYLETYIAHEDIKLINY